MYESSNASSNSIIDISNIVLYGSNNYYVNNTYQIEGSISPIQLSVDFNANNKLY